MSNDPVMTDEQMELVRKLLEDIGKLGVAGVVGQYAIYANLYVETINDSGRGARMTRAEQLLPLVIVLSNLFEIPDERVPVLIRALNDGTVRAAFQAKFAGSERIRAEHADEALEWAMARMRNGEYD